MKIHSGGVSLDPSPGSLAVRWRMELFCVILSLKSSQRPQTYRGNFKDETLLPLLLSLFWNKGLFFTPEELTYCSRSSGNSVHVLGTQGLGLEVPGTERGPWIILTSEQAPGKKETEPGWLAISCRFLRPQACSLSADRKIHRGEQRTQKTSRAQAGIHFQVNWDRLLKHLLGLYSSLWPWSGWMESPTIQAGGF